MKCIDCPYGYESYEKYKLYTDEEDIENYIWCDKVGGKTHSLGYCSDRYEHNKEKRKSKTKKKRMNKRERYLKHQEHLRYLHRVSGQYYPSPIRYVDEIWIKGVGYVDNPKPYYRRLYRGERSKYLKQQSNKKIRRYKGELHKGYQHIHKLYDFWWKYC